MESPSIQPVGPARDELVRRPAAGDRFINRGLDPTFQDDRILRQAAAHAGNAGHPAVGIHPQSAMRSSISMANAFPSSLEGTGN